MKRSIRDGLFYLAGVATLPFAFVAYRVGVRVSHNFDPSYTGHTIGGTVIRENKSADPFGIYELELRAEDGQARMLRVDCGRTEPVFGQVYGQAKSLEKFIVPSDIVEFQVTEKGEPTWLWNFDRTTCPSE